MLECGVAGSRLARVGSCYRIRCWANSRDQGNYLLLKNMEVSVIQISDCRVRTTETMQQAFTESLSLAAEGRITAGKRMLYPMDQQA